MIIQAQDGWDQRGGLALAGGCRAEDLGTSFQDCELLAAPISQPGSALVGRSRSQRQLGSAGSVQQGAAAVRG